MKKRDTLNTKLQSSRGILHLPRDSQMDGLALFEPSGSLASFVEHYWGVEWKDQAPLVRETVPSPSVHLVIEQANSQIHGIYQEKFCRTIEGTGKVLGVKFRPGGFRTFLGRSVAELTGKISEPTMILGNRFGELEENVLSNPSMKAAFTMIDDALQALRPDESTQLVLVTKIIECVTKDHSIVRAQQLAEVFSLSLRQLQRICQEYVGVGPKWIIQRYRLIEAAERMRNIEPDFDFAKLAVDLGYSDQAHLIRDFKLFVGTTPAKYKSSLES